jgi:hypothetical protein
MSTMILEDADLARLVHGAFRNGPLPLYEVIQHVTRLSAANAVAYNTAYAHHQETIDDPARGCTEEELFSAYRKIANKRVYVHKVLTALQLIEYNLDEQINRIEVAESLAQIKSWIIYHLIDAMRTKKTTY